VSVRKALDVRTADGLPVQWAQTNYGLAVAYEALAQWTDAAQSLRNVSRVYPDDAGIYSALESLYHEKLFDFEAAFALSRDWLEQHPGDPSARSGFAEAAFTDGRFAESEKHVKDLSTDTGLSAGSRVALRALEVVTLVAQQITGSVPGKLQDLDDLISAQPADFKIGWVWTGAVHFIEEDDRMKSARDWLLSLLAAPGGSDRETILKGLRDSAASFRATSKPLSVEGAEADAPARLNGMLRAGCGYAVSKWHRVADR